MNYSEQYKKFDDAAGELDIQAYLRYAEELIRQLQVPEKRRAELEKKINGARTRAADPQMRLAVIGTFSAGKSTFINAMLREPLLHTATEAATGAATFIRYGTEKKAVVLLKDSQKIDATENDCKELMRAVTSWNAQPTGNSFQELLQCVTSQPNATKQIERVDVYVPCRKLQDNLCLIDTPGIDAAAEGTAEHREITERIVTGSADAAIILLPSYRIMVRDFAEFLQEFVSPKLHRCAFVITRMDDLQEGDIEELVPYLRKTLQKLVNIKHPIIFTTAAAAVLHKDKSSSDEYWAAQFEQMEKSLLHLMTGQRKITVAEEIVGILQDLFKDMDADFAFRRKELQKESALLDRHTVEHLDIALERITQRTRECLTDTFQNQQEMVEMLGKDFSSRSDHEVISLMSGASRDTIDSLVSTELGKKIENCRTRYINNLQRSMQSLSGEYEKVFEGFHRDFEDFYRELPKLKTVTLPVLPAVEPPRVDVPAFASFFSSLQEDKDKSTKGKLTGAGGGAAVGFMIGGPLGALIGAGIGALAGSVVTDNWDKTKVELQKSLQADVSEYCLKCTGQVQVDFMRTSSVMNTALRNMEQSYRKAYETAVDRLIKEHQADIAQNEKEKAFFEQLRSEAAKKEEELESFRKQLFQLTYVEDQLAGRRVLTIN